MGGIVRPTRGWDYMPLIEIAVVIFSEIIKVKTTSSVREREREREHRASEQQLEDMQMQFYGRLVFLLVHVVVSLFFRCCSSTLFFNPSSIVPSMRWVYLFRHRRCK